MLYLNKHKAIIITALLTGALVLGMFTIHIKKKSLFIAESLYVIEPKTEDELKKELQNHENESKAKTDKAFNEDEELKKLMKNFKSVPLNDFEATSQSISEQKNSFEENTKNISERASYKTTGRNAIKEHDTETYNRLKQLIDKKTSNRESIDVHANTKSTLTYSLKNRTLLNYNTPRYLCQTPGKIIVNIKVNANGNVFETYINGASTSTNQCLIEHALEYAKASQFNASKNTQQLGSITFYFKGK